MRELPKELVTLAAQAAEGPWFVQHGATKDGLSQIDDGRRHGMFPVRGEAHEIAFLHAAGEFVRALIAERNEKEAA